MRGYDRGFGEKKKHRGKGSHGGKGYAGSTKHKKSYIRLFEPRHFDHKGFHPPAKKETRIINVKDLDRISKGMADINLSELGYSKLLGGGEIKSAVTVIVPQFSKVAKEKVEKAGGKVA
jgi:large subunit ribosomal protein L15